MKTNLIEKISIKNRDKTPSWISKTAWQLLFNVYVSEEGDANHLHDLLCDLRTIENALKNIRMNYYVFNWYFDQTGYTEIDFPAKPCFMNIHEEAYYKLTIDMVRELITLDEVIASERP